MPMRNSHTFAETFATQHASQRPLGAPNVYVTGRRIAATLLDFIPLGLLTWVVDSTFGVTQNLSVLSPPAGIPYASSTAVAFPWLYLVLITYYTVQEALFGTTFGKSLMGLKVVQDDGSPLTLSSALLRNIVRPIDATSGYLLGWIFALFSSCRRRLGDHLAGTLVVSADSLPARSPRSSRPWLRLSILAILCASFGVFCLSFDYYGRPLLVIQGLANGNGPASIFTDRGTITDLTLSQPTWQANTVTYTMTFQALGHGTVSNCQGHITLRWSGFVSGWWDYSGDTICNPIASRVSVAYATSNAMHSAKVIPDLSRSSRLLG